MDMHDWLELMGVDDEDTRDLIVDQGFVDLDVLCQREPKFAIGVCKGVRRRDGDVSQLAEERMSELILWARFAYITNRPLAYEDADVDSMEVVKKWFASIKAEPKMSVETFNPSVSKRRAWFESVGFYLAELTGSSSKVPLAYVIRLDGAPAPARMFPQDVGADVAFNGRHDGHFWSDDNGAVWRLLQSKVHGTDAWSTIMTFEAAQDGRGAYLALIHAYMGAQMAATLQTHAQRLLQTLRYDGTKRNFPFQLYLSKLRRAFADLGYNLPDELKVKWLWTHVKHCKTFAGCDKLIKRDPGLNQNFEATVGWLTELVADSSAPEQMEPRNVSSVSSKPKTNKHFKGKAKDNAKGSKYSKKSHPTKFDPKNPGQYYPPAVWKKMTPEQRKASAEAKKAAKGGSNNQISELVTQQQEMARQVQELTARLSGSQPQGTAPAQGASTGTASISQLVTQPSQPTAVEVPRALSATNRNNHVRFAQPLTQCPQQPSVLPVLVINEFNVVVPKHSNWSPLFYLLQLALWCFVWLLILR